MQTLHTMHTFINKHSVIVEGIWESPAYKEKVCKVCLTRVRSAEVCMWLAL